MGVLPVPGLFLLITIGKYYVFRVSNCCSAPGRWRDWAGRVHFSSVRTFWKAAVLDAHIYIRLYMNDYAEIFFLPVIHETIHRKMLGLSIKNSCSFKLETNKAVSLTPSN